MPKSKTPTVNAKKGPAPQKTADFDPEEYSEYGKSQEIMEIKEAFDLFDSDKSGEVDVEELRTAILNLGIDAKSKTLDNMISSIDANKSGSIDFEEFLQMMTAPAPPKNSRDDLRKVFELFAETDENYVKEKEEALKKNKKLDDPKIGIKHLKDICTELGETLTDDEIAFMVNRADKDKDGLVSFDEFYEILTRNL